MKYFIIAMAASFMAAIWIPQYAFQFSAMGVVFLMSMLGVVFCSTFCDK